MTTDLLLLLALFTLNGAFAMFEIALVSARRARLTHLADGGHPGAAQALTLSADPTRFLSTIQVGITGIGILSGAIGEAAIADRLAGVLVGVPWLAQYAAPLSLGVMVILLTYVSLVIGELVPKRIGLAHPERIASFAARPMAGLAAAGRPLVHLLSASTDILIRLLRLPAGRRAGVTPEEITVLMAQGAEEGVFDRMERDIVANVLHLDERQVGAVLTPRSDVVFLDADLSFAENHARLVSTPHTILPLCRGGLDDVVGFVRATEILARVLRGEAVDLTQIAMPAVFVPRTANVMALLQQFRQSHVPVALVVDEFGVVTGLVSLTDVTAAIVGDLPETTGTDAELVRRADGSWLVDGAMDLDRLQHRLGVVLRDDEHHDFHTVGGLAMDALGHVPVIGDTFARGGHRFEIVDMDGHRVDRILVTEDKSADRDDTRSV